MSQRESLALPNTAPSINLAHNLRDTCLYSSSFLVSIRPVFLKVTFNTRHSNLEQLLPSAFRHTPEWPSRHRHPFSPVRVIQSRWLCVLCHENVSHLHRYSTCLYPASIACLLSSNFDLFKRQIIVPTPHLYFTVLAEPRERSFEQPLHLLETQRRQVRRSPYV